MIAIALTTREQALITDRDICQSIHCCLVTVSLASQANTRNHCDAILSRMLVASHSSRLQNTPQHYPLTLLAEEDSESVSPRGFTVLDRLIVLCASLLVRLE